VRFSAPDGEQQAVARGQERRDHPLVRPEGASDPTRRDELTTAVREVGRALRADERVVPALLPAGDGLLLAVRR
jgi:predicted O-methyltransferase YrrM